MSEFPFSLVGTKLSYLLPTEMRPPAEPADRVCVLARADSLLSFSTPEKLALRRATNVVGTKPPDQVLQSRFFEYVPRYITICRTGKGGFLSGPFSGCWFIRFFTAGAYHAAHIGTTMNKEHTREVKRAFVDYTEGTQAFLFSCFNPNKAWPDDEKLELLAGSRGFFNLAYINPAGKCYSIFLVRDGKQQLTTKPTPNSFRTPANKALITKAGPLAIPQKPVWVSTPSKNGALDVSARFTVKGVREVVSRTWTDVRANEFPA